MCSISGCFIPKNLAKFNESVLSKLDSIITSSTERGRDSSGVICFGPGREPVIRRIIGTYQSDLIKDIPNPENLSIVINNNRAEPTTEWIKKKNLNDVQPFNSQNIYVTHNGIFANDKNFNYPTKSKIDTAVIPHLLEDKGITWETIQSMQGSFAMAVVDNRQTEVLYLYRDYEPLYVAYDFILNVWFFSSSKKYLGYEDCSLIGKVFEVPPFSLCIITDDGFKILKTQNFENNQALVICSGGLDSTTAATHAQFVDKCQITLIHCLYGCKAQKKEIKAVTDIAKYLNCDYEFVDTSWLKKIGGSKLTDDLQTITEGEAGAEYPHEWVPARNLILVALAAAISEVKGASKIYMGLNLEEASAYPDNTMEFYEACNKILPYATLNRPKIFNPLGHLMKWEIVKYALSIKAPIHLSWSCYDGKEKPCGKCGPCYMRRKAFEINGIEDMLEYA